MNFKTELLEGVLLQRYKRFFADIEYGGEKITIHVPNTGSLKGVISKSGGQKCWFSLHGDDSKKLKGTLEAVQAESGAWVGVNTSLPNKVVREAIEDSLKAGTSFFEHWKAYGFYRWEYKINDETRLDGVFCTSESDLENEKSAKHFIEIKNTTMLGVVNGTRCAMFPDAVTERGQKHLKEMMKLLSRGHKAELIFTIQRNDVEAFAPADDIDPEYGKLLREAVGKGLIVTAAVVAVDRKEVKLTKKILPLKI